MGWLKPLAFATAAVAASAFCGTAQASTFIDFGIVPLGATPSYTGATLDASTMFDFGGGVDIVNVLANGDKSGLSVGNVVTLSGSVSYPGNSGSTFLAKSWVDSLGSFTETLTSFAAVRTAVNAITLYFSGLLAGPDGLSEPVFAILTANQSGGPGNAINWSITDTSVNPASTPLPAALPLFALGLGTLGSLGLLGQRRRRRVLSPFACV